MRATRVFALAIGIALVAAPTGMGTENPGCPGAIEGCAPSGSDLRMSMHGPAKVYAGQWFGYQVRLVNRGDASAPVRLEQVLPPGVTLDRRAAGEPVVVRTRAKYRAALAAWRALRAEKTDAPSTRTARRVLVGSLSAYRLARTGCDLPTRSVVSRDRTRVITTTRNLGGQRKIVLRCRARTSLRMPRGTVKLSAGSLGSAPLALGYPAVVLPVKVGPAPRIDNGGPIFPAP